MPDMVEKLAGADEVAGSQVVVDVVFVSMVPGPSSVAVPITQCNLLVSRSGQVIPEFSCWRSSTDSPQMLAKLSQVSPLVALVVKEHSTARRESAQARPGMSPAAARCVSYILLNVSNGSVGEVWVLARGWCLSNR